jgi:ketol-acid reductoisomerase
MRRILAEITSGEFAKEWILENANGRPKFEQMRKEQAGHLIEDVGKRLRGMMPWIKR